MRLCLCMKRLIVSFILLGLAQVAHSQTALSKTVDERFDYILRNLRVPDGLIDGQSFWRDPIGNAMQSPDNGWKGAQISQGIYMNYMRTRDAKYLGALQAYANWLMYRCDLELTEAGRGVNQWSDDAGWNISNFVMLYNIDRTKNRPLLDSAYLLLNSADAYWGIDLQGRSRALRYNREDGGDHYTLYNVNYLLGALELYMALKDIDINKANRSLEFAGKLYNFIENYLHSKGIGSLNITQTEFTVPKDLYQGVALFGMANPPPSAKSTVESYGFFLFAQMGMASVYEMLNQLKDNSIVASTVLVSNLSFRQKAISAAEMVVKHYPGGMSEQSNINDDHILINAHDKRVNAFACYWWIKYVMPLNAKKYGGAIVNTAKAIVRNYDASPAFGSCWNSIYSSQKGAYDSVAKITSCTNSNSWYESSDFAIHANAATLISAAAWIEAITQASLTSRGVKLSANQRPFRCGKFETSYRDYFAVMSTKGKLPIDTSSVANLDLPVTNITAYDAIIYCNEKSRQSGLQPVYSYDPKVIYDDEMHSVFLANLRADLSNNGYRLPSFDEWSSMYRAGTTTPYFWGAKDPNLFAWNSANSNGVAHEVGLKLPNIWGVYDISGNVGEYVLSYGNTLAVNVAGGSYLGGDYTYNSNQSVQSLASKFPSVGFRVFRTYVPDIKVSLDLVRGCSP